MRPDCKDRDFISEDLRERIHNQGITRCPDEQIKQALNGDISMCRVIFLGPPGSGKSSLIQRILDDKRPVQSESVPTTGMNDLWGITMARWKSDERDSLCCLQFMDFGGQELQTNVHRCFMTARTIYVLVSDLNAAQTSLSANDEIDVIGRWLYETRLYAPKSSVLVALNKSDLVDAKNIPSLDGALTKAGVINGAVRRVLDTSAVTENREEAVRELIDAIRTEIRRCLKGRRKTWRGNWRLVKEDLETLNQNYVSQAKYREICRKRRIFLPFQQKRLLARLHDQGVFYVPFRMGSADSSWTRKERAAVSDSMILLQPRWLKKCIYHVILYIRPDNAPDSEPGGGQVKDEPKRNPVVLAADVIRVLRCLNGLAAGKLESITPENLSPQIDISPDFSATDKERKEKDCLLFIMRRLNLSFQSAPDEEFIPARMTKAWDMKDDNSTLHQRWTVDKISQSGVIFEPSFHPFILHYLLSRKADIFTDAGRNYAQFSDDNSDSRIRVALDTRQKSDLHLYFWGEKDKRGKRFLKKFRSLIRAYLKRYQISATEYAYDNMGTHARPIQELKRNARFPSASDASRADYATLKDYSLFPELPLPFYKKASPPFSGFPKATRFLINITLAMVAAIAVVSGWQFVQGGKFPAAVISAVVAAVTLMILARQFLKRRTRPAKNKKTARPELSESAANARMTETKRRLLILAVVAGTLLVVAVVATILFFVNSKRLEYDTLMKILKDLSDLIKSGND